MELSLVALRGSFLATLEVLNRHDSHSLIDMMSLRAGNWNQERPFRYAGKLSLKLSSKRAWHRSRLLRFGKAWSNRSGYERC